MIAENFTNWQISRCLKLCSLLSRAMWIVLCFSFYRSMHWTQLHASDRRTNSTVKCCLLNQWSEFKWDTPGMRFGCNNCPCFVCWLVGRSFSRLLHSMACFWTCYAKATIIIRNEMTSITTFNISKHCSVLFKLPF